MTKRQALGRHRGTPVHTNPLGSISKAVSSNAGSVGRQAAVIAAASGLVLTLGVPAQANPAARTADKAPASVNMERTAVQSVKVDASKSKPADIKAQVKVPKVAGSTDGSDAIAKAKAEEAKREAAAERRAEAAQEAAAERQQAAQDAAAEREAAQEAAAEREAAAGAAMTRQSRQESTQGQSAQQSTQGQVTTASTPKKAETTSTPSAGLSGIAATAMQYKGSPYVYGGETPSGWDCSGFVKYVYAQHGISLPHGTSALRGSGKFVQTSSPKPGDLVFQNGGGHVGIYIGGGKIIGAQNPSVGTVERPANSQYGPLTGYYTYVG